MDKQTVYVVMQHNWQYNFGETDNYDEWIDSIWSNKDDAKRRVDDLANEYIRQYWYEHGGIDDGEDGWCCDLKWNDEKTAVVCSMDQYASSTYCIDEVIVNPVLEDFEGP